MANYKYSGTLHKMVNEVPEPVWKNFRHAAKSLGSNQSRVINGLMNLWMAALYEDSQTKRRYSGRNLNFVLNDMIQRVTGNKQIEFHDEMVDLADLEMDDEEIEKEG